MHPDGFSIGVGEVVILAAVVGVIVVALWRGFFW